MANLLNRLSTQMNIITEVAGTVFSIEVAIGQSVEPDDVLAYIESMKMEIPITTSSAGMIQSISIQPGDSVKENQVVMIVAS
jgi:acetyl-CoA carboxylase biotin carboxyl carrier protein